MGKSSPTKLQLKHIPDIVVLQTVFGLQNLWVVRSSTVLEDRGDSLYLLPNLNRLTYEQKRVAHLSEIVEHLKPLPAKLVWRKLQKLEDQGKIASYGPSSTHYKVEMD